MVKSVLAVNTRGLREWFFQRLTAVVMVFYSVGMLFYFFNHPNLEFIDWRALFNHASMKVATLLFIASMLYHTWVGLWTVMTDYIKPFFLSMLAHVFVLLMLVACFFWALEILWSI